MEFHVLGPVRVSRDGHDVPVPGVLQRRLLGVLLARAGRPVPVDVLTDALWPGDQHAAGLPKLQLQVSRLRKLLGDPARISFEPDAYRLLVEAAEVDSARFERLADDASRVADARPERCVELVDTALALWHGPAFGDLDVPVLADEARRLAERRLAVTELGFEARLRCGRHAEVVGELTELVGRHPLRERLAELLMTALYRSGRRAEALAVYRSTRDSLVEELGLEPGPELRAVEQRVLAGAEVELGTFTASLPVPAQLPHTVSGFVGRDAELSELDSVLAGADGSGPVPICVLAGTAGVGKTALAVRWAHRVREEFPDGQLYVDLRGYGPDQPVAPADVLAGFLRELGLDATAIPSERSERSARFRSVVDRRRLLVVLDNAHTVEQVRPLLPGSASCFVLVTSRDALTGLAVREGAHRVRLDRLPRDDARDLLHGLVGARALGDRGAVDLLIARCARLPLALRVAAELVRLRPGAAVAELVAELTGERDRLDLLAVDGDQHSSVRAVLSWSYHHLPADAARLFRLCGLHPGPDLDVRALAALAGVDVPTARRWLDPLVRAHLVEETPDRRLRLHDLLSVYAAELVRSTDGDADRDAALARLFDFYLETTVRATGVVLPEESELRGPRPTPPLAVPELTTLTDAMGWLEAERVNLLAVAELAADRGASRYTTGLSTLLWRYLDVGAYFDEADRLHGRALAVARAEGDQATEGIALRSIGLRHHRFDRYEVAVRHLATAVALHERVGDRRLLAISLNYLAGAEFQLGHVRESIDRVLRAIDLFGEVGAETLRAGSLCNLAFVCRRTGRYEDAFRYLEEGIAVGRRYDSPIAQVHGLRQLAALCHEVGRAEEALEHARTALAMANEHSIHHMGSALHTNLGQIHTALGDYEQAAQHHRRGLTDARRLGSAQQLANALVAAAALELITGFPTRAHGYLAEALDIAQRNGRPYEQALAHAGLGDVHDRHGDHGPAAEHWRRARDLYREAGAPQAADLDARLAASPVR